MDAGEGHSEARGFFLIYIYLHSEERAPATLSPPPRIYQVLTLQKHELPERFNHSAQAARKRTKEVVGLNCTCPQMSVLKTKEKKKHRLWLKTKKTNRTFRGRVRICGDKSEIRSWGLERCSTDTNMSEYWALLKSCLQFVTDFRERVNKKVVLCFVSL